MALTPTPTPTPASSTSLTEKIVTVAVVAIAAGLAAFSGMHASAESKAFLVIPLAGAAAIALGLLALTRFNAFVVALLVARASIDIAKLSGSSAGNTVTNTGARAADPSSLLAVVFLLGASLWLAAQLRKNGALPGSALRRALVAFVIAGLLSVIGSANHLPSLVEWIRILAAVMMFAVLEQLMFEAAMMRRLLVATYLSTIFPLAFTAFGFLTGSPRSELKGSFTRIVGTFNQSNAFGRYLMLMIIFGVALYPHLAGRYRRILAFILAPSAVFLVLTYTRSALIGTALGLLVVGALQSKRLLGSLLIAGLCALAFVPQLGARFSDLADKPDTLQEDAGNSLVWRLKYWADVIPLAKSNPVTGIGLAQTQYNTEDQKQPHNDFVRAYVETGIIGFFAYVFMMGSFIWLGRRALKVAPKGSLDRGVAVGFLGCAIAVVSVSFIANLMSNVVVLWYFLAFAAAASSVARRHEAPLEAGVATVRS